jgi:hypothetical protein
MRRSGWIVAVVGAVATVWLGLAVTAFVHRQEIFTLVKERPSHVPTPAKAFVLPLPEAPATLPFVGEEGLFPDGYPKKTTSSVGMRALLRHRRFDALTSYIEQTEREALADFHKEYWAMDAVQSFGCPDPTLESLLDEWIARSPRAPTTDHRSAGTREARSLRATHRGNSSKLSPGI